MVFQYRAPDNTYTQDVAGGTVATAASREEVVAWVSALEPWKTPFLTEVMTNDEFEYELHQWGQSFRPEMESTVATAMTAGATTIPVAAGDGVLFKKGDVLAIYDGDASGNLIDASKQNVIVTDTPSGDNIPVEAVTAARAVGAVVRIIGSSEPLNSEHTEAPRTRGIRLFNYPQRFQAKLTADKRAQNQPTWEHPDNPFLADFAEEQLRQKVLLERAVFEGERRAGTGSTASLMGGLHQFITTNVVDLAGATIGPDQLDDVLTDLELATESAGNKRLVMGYNEARILDTSIDSIRRADVQDDTLNRVVRAYDFRVGRFEVTPMRNVPPGNIYVLDMANIKVRPFKGLNWHVSGKDGTDHAVDHDVKAISGDFTLEVQAEHAMARITNFNTNLAAYRA